MRSEKDWVDRTRKLYLSDYPPRIQKVLQEVKDRSDLPNPIESYYIHGEIGYGKTILAAQMMLEEQKRIYLDGGPIEHTDKCCFVSTPTLFQEIKNTYNKDSLKTEQQVIDQYNSYHLLVLDDFAVVKPTDWVLHTLYVLINYRYDYLKKIIITSNLTLPQVANFFGDDRITSRIDRMCTPIEKENWRKK